MTQAENLAVALCYVAGVAGLLIVAHLIWSFGDGRPFWEKALAAVIAAGLLRFGVMGVAAEIDWMMSR